MKEIVKSFTKWAPVIAIAIATSVFDEKKKDKEYAELKQSILKELRDSQ